MQCKGVREKAFMKKQRNTESTHGKTTNFRKTTLEQVWGDTGLSRYKTLDLEEYKAHIKGMSKSDLQSHAANVGVLPKDDTGLLSKNLIKEFCSYSAGFKRPNSLGKAKSSGAPSEVVASILSEGR